MSFFKKICCCFKEQVQEQDVDKDYEPNYAEKRLSSDSKSSYLYSESFDNSEKMNKKVTIINNFMQVYKSETFDRLSLDSFNEDITPKRGVQKGKELYLKAVKRQESIHKMERLLLKEAEKTEEKRQKLLEHKPSDLDIVHMSMNRAFKLKAEDNVNTSMAVAILEEDINEQQRFILKRTQEFQEKDFSSSIKKNEKALIQINATEESIASEKNIFDNLLEPRVIQDTTTEILKCNDEEVFLTGSSSDEHMKIIDN